MNVLAYLIPVALLFGFASLAVFLWALKSGQYEDLDGAAERVLLDSDPEDNENPGHRDSGMRPN